MKLTKVILIFLLLPILVVGCAKKQTGQVVVDEKNSKLLNYEFKIKDFNSMDDIMSKQRYLYTTDIDKTYVAIAVYESPNTSMKQYLVQKDKTVDLTISKDSTFVISLYANSTVAYTWNIKNDINNELIKFIKKSKIDIPLPNPKIHSDGTNYGRENFSFKSLKVGSEKIVLRYEHQTDQQNEFFK